MEELLQVHLNDTHVALGAKMVPFAGYNMPVLYTNLIEEHNCVRNGVGVFDVSHMGEFFLKGEKALDLIQYVTSNDAAKLVDGKVQYSCLPNATGGIVDDLLVYKIRDNEYLLVVNASNIDKDWNWISSHNTFGVEMTNASSAYSLFAVQGPKAAGVLQTLTAVDLSAMPYYTFKIGSMAGFDDVIISNTGYTGAGGFEIYVKNENALAMWNAIFAAGASEGIQPIGLGARDTLRTEKGYCLYGHDIDDTTSPIEAGLGWITSFNKDFIMKDHHAAIKAAGPSKKLVGFEMIDRGIPRQHYPILNAAGEVIGEVTSGTQSPTLSKGIGMGYVSTAHVGSEIFISIREKAVKAEIVKMPFL
ncbi:glycine cleavage system aminomethyltransferase GcvT [Aquirufa regiilacus]|uniref:Aminomethyltransferase n=1 Tax=Aquirufa regiilacus TaxID=3024868 RepID=A0ABU3TS48_9BACT|nr:MULTISPECIES: glycine cleavage system aminomethyltransferase GcvT [unclassified Aquirufa]MDT8886370.1 glycine cleavage system aminomethyltransferase GcvT [Aquirufa sp. LEPPI-3A]MDU0808700.1 glycine cleavage system aminomethyltransferase GcvT [Aquirufa sp. LEOWEIH-7C]